MEQIEQYYEISGMIYNICTILLTAYCYVVWVRPFVTGGMRVWLVGAVYAAVMLTLNFMPYYISPMPAYVIGTMAAFPVMCLIDREYIWQKLFLAVTFFCLRWQSWRIVSCISNEVFLALVQMFSSRSEMFWFRIQIGLDIADSLTGFLFMYGAARFLQRAYGHRRERMDVREFLLLAMPSVSGAFSYGVLRYYADVYERDTGKSTWDLYGGHDLLMLFYTVLCFVTILTMAYVFRQWKNEQEEEKQREVFSRQMEDLENHITEVERLYRDMRSLRHDMGNHLMTLEQLYGSGQYETAEKYAGTLRERMQDAAADIKSGNPVTDVILSGRKKEMEEKGIAFACDFHYPAAGAVDAFDISIILNNALSNAIEAAEREKSARAGRNDTDVISRAAKGREDGGEDSKEDSKEDKAGKNMANVSVSSHRTKNMYMIEITNSYTGGLQIDAASGLPRTTKSGGGHGFGLAGIRHVAHKYLGDIEIGKEKCEGEERCVLRVMLQITP